MLIKDIMTNTVITVPSDMPVKEFGRLLKEKRISGAPVTNKQGKMIGIVTITDMLKVLKDIHNWKKLEVATPGLDLSVQLEKEKESATIEKYMTKLVLTIDQNETIDALFELMFENNIHSIPVTDNDKLVGIVGVRDIISVCF